jgi:hypothetical protein
MNHERTDKVIPIRQAEIDTESKVLAAFERVQTELASIDTIEDALKLRTKAELLRILATKVRCAKSTLDEIAALKVRSERRLGELLATRPETRGGDHKSIEFQKSKDDEESFDPPPTLEILGVPKHVSRRSQIMASIPEDMFEARIEYTKKLNRGRDLSAEMWSYAKYLQRERERQERRRAAAEEAKRVDPDDKIRIFHGDFREVLNEETVPTNSVSLVLTDPMYGREHLPLWADLARFASRVLKPGSLLVTYSGQTYLPEVLNALEAHLTYVWIAGVRYSYPNNIFPLRIKNSLKLLLLFSKGAYDPGPSQYWLHDLIDGDGYPETKRDSELQQGIREAEYLIETLTHPGDLVVDPFTGTGTVPVAAKRKGRRFIGAEISKERYELAVSRIAQEASE